MSGSCLLGASEGNDESLGAFILPYHCLERQRGEGGGEGGLFCTPYRRHNFGRGREEGENIRNLGIGFGVIEEDGTLIVLAGKNVGIDR